MLTREDKEKCAKLYYWATNDHTQPEVWNEPAANLLAEMYAQMANCSNAVDYVPRPAGSKPGWAYLVTYVYQALAAKMNGSRRIYDMCQTARVYQYKRLIEIALQTGE